MLPNPTSTRMVRGYAYATPRPCLSPAVYRRCARDGKPSPTRIEASATVVRACGTRSEIVIPRRREPARSGALVPTQNSVPTMTPALIWQ